MGEGPTVRKLAVAAAMLAVVVVSLAGCTAAETADSPVPSAADATTDRVGSASSTTTTKGGADEVDPVSSTARPQSSEPAPVLHAEREVELQELGLGPDHWTTLFSIPYGDEVELLGRASIGEDAYWIAADGCSVDPQGRLWVAEAAKTRFAVFSPSGEFAGEIPIPSAHLVDGRYFQYQNLAVATDGTLATWQDTDSGVEILLYSSGAFETVNLAGYWEYMGVVADLIFFADGQDGAIGALDMSNHTFSSGDFAASARGFSQIVDSDRLVVTRHPSGEQIPIRFVSSDDQPLYWSAQSQPGTVGDLWLDVRAAPESGAQLGGVVHLVPGDWEATVHPLPFDSGDETLRSTSSMFIHPGSGQPTLCVARDEVLEVVTLRS